MGNDSVGILVLSASFFNAERHNSAAVANANTLAWHVFSFLISFIFLLLQLLQLLCIGCFLAKCTSGFGVCFLPSHQNTASIRVSIQAVEVFQV